MNGRIGHAQCRFRLVGGAGRRASVSRLEWVAREHVPAALERALEPGAGEDPAVIVLRRVEAPLVHLESGAPDTAVARRWAQELAASIECTIASDPGGGPNLVRFADEAEYVARFVGDLLDATAWSRWFYGPLGGYRRGTVRETLDAVLTGLGDSLPSALAAMHKLGILDRALRTLGEEAAVRVLTTALDHPAHDPEAALPLVAAACRLVDALDAWNGPRPRDSEVVERYLATRPRPPTWRDRVELADAVADVLRLLVRDGELGRFDPARLESALRSLDWLDTETLRASVLELAQPAAADEELPVRPRDAPASPALARLLAELERLWRAGEAPFESGGSRGIRLLRTLGAFAARAPDAAAQPSALATIELLGTARDTLSRCPAPDEVLRHLAAHDAAGALRALDPSERDRARGAFGVLARAGSAGAGALAAAHASDDLAPWLDSECAGALLLLRAALDAGLPALIREARHPVAIPDVLAAAALRLAGDSGAPGGRLDPAVAILTDAATVDALRRRWRTTRRSAQRRLRRVVTGRLAALSVEPEVLPDEGGTLALARADALLGLLAAGMLRLWARWIRGFASSSPGFLLDTFVRRPGRVRWEDDVLLVELPRRPLDVALEVAGYFDELDATTLGIGRVRFEVRDD